MTFAGVTHIYFDWSGTLAKSGSKKYLMDGSLAEKRATLYADTLDTLEYLKSRGYKIGLISNTSKPAQKLLAAFRDIGVAQYFNASVLFNGSRMCRKPCAEIFEHVLQRDKVVPQHAVMIGNDYKKDIVGAKGVGMHTIHIDKSRRAAASGTRIHSISQLKQIL
jgi:HAD superfamily hydrolase (TIGR01662 family)